MLSLYDEGRRSSPASTQLLTAHEKGAERQRVDFVYRPFVCFVIDLILILSIKFFNAASRNGRKISHPCFI